MGQYEVDGEAHLSASSDNWKLGGAGGGALVAFPPGPGAAGAASAAHALWAKRRRPAALLILGAAVLAIPVAVHPVVNAPRLGAALETLITLLALAGAWLLRAGFADSRRVRDLLLIGATLALGAINFCVAALPAALGLHTTGYFPAAGLWGQLCVAGIFATAACAPSRWVLSRSGHPVALTTSLCLAALAVAGLGGLVGPSAHASGPTHPLLLMLVLGTTGLLAYAASGFARRRGKNRDRVPALVALAALLLAAAGLSHLTAHSLPPEEIGAGDVLRVLALAFVLVAAVALERRVHARLAGAAALAERRRVARDLHDGLAQDLAFIATHGPRIAEELGDTHPVVVAARRALAISRSHISDLSDPAGATTHESLEAVAQELRERFDLAIAVHVQLDNDLAPGTREHLTRITREAIANAARHGQSRNVLVSLRHVDTGVSLRIVDDGCGIAGADGAVHEGFGLRSMRERAAAVGGLLSVRAVRRGGTELEVILP